MAGIALVAVLLLVIAIVGAYALSGGFRDWSWNSNADDSNAPNDNSPSNLPSAPSDDGSDQPAGSEYAQGSGGGSGDGSSVDSGPGDQGAPTDPPAGGSDDRSSDGNGATSSDGSGTPGEPNEQPSGGSGIDDGTGSGSGTANDSGDDQSGNGNQSNESGPPAVGTVSVSGYGAERTATGNQTMFYMMLYVQMPSVASQPDPAVTRTVLSINGTTYENPDLVYPRVGSGSCMAYVRVPDSAYLPGAPYTLTGYSGDQVVVTASGSAPA
jgi:hypothetical protein